MGIHPGQFLQEILDEIGLTADELSSATGLQRSQIEELLRGDGCVTPDVADRLGGALGQTPQYWINLQAIFTAQ